MFSSSNSLVYTRDVQPFSNLGQILCQAKVDGPQKAVHVESRSNFLISVPSFRCSLKRKKRSSPIFSLQFLNFCSKLQVFSKKNKIMSSPRISRCLSISAPNVFQQSPGTPLRNLHYCQKLEMSTEH